MTTVYGLEAQMWPRFDIPPPPKEGKKTQKGERISRASDCWTNEASLPHPSLRLCFSLWAAEQLLESLALPRGSRILLPRWLRNCRCWVRHVFVACGVPRRARFVQLLHQSWLITSNIQSQSDQAQSLRPCVEVVWAPLLEVQDTPAAITVAVLGSTMIRSR